jgi:aerobic-type carbon monoxide dehydrogenase small subunit (CoxS/CutS family)
MPTIKELHVNGATGCKYGCGEGRCGACTVLLDGQPIRSCTTQVGTVVSKQVRTIEDLAKGDKLHPLQEAFLKADALQCGYCTCGMIMTALGLLTKDPQPSREDILRGMSVNLCRCGAYQRIVTAIEMAAKEMKGGDK